VVPAAHPARRRGRLGWLLQPRTVRFRVSPLGAVAAAGIAVAALLGLRREAERAGEQERRLAGTGEFPVATGEFPAVSRGGRPATPDTVFVTRFVFVAPDAKQVSIAGDFNDWDTASIRLVKDSRHENLWTADVPLRPGRYDYAFYVDGKWLADPAAPRAVGDDFGRPSSTVTVNL
jgi:hypothetical protein